MNIAVVWQDADSSSANAIKENFPDCKVMLCGGHAGSAHYNTLEGYITWKEPIESIL